MISQQNDMYQAYTNNELAIVLSHFNQDYVYSIVKQSMSPRIFHQNTIPNIVTGFEIQFKDILASYPLESGRINDLRKDIYETIIRMICNYYNLEFDDNNQTDTFSSAQNMYGFFVSNFRNQIIKFFSLYIFQERNALYDLLMTYDRKSINTSYNKKLYKNQKWGIISTNIDTVISNICTFDIPFDRYLSIANMCEAEVAQHLINILRPLSNFFKEYVGIAFLSPERQNLITDIRISLQDMIPDAELHMSDYVRDTTI